MKANPTAIANLDRFLNRIDQPRGVPEPGALLVAEPFLRESFFHHSIIYLIDYGPGASSMGIVMNKPTNYHLANLLKVNIKRNEAVPVYCGGPMSSDRLYFIHRLGDIIPDSRPISADLYIGGDFGSMVDYVNAGYPLDGLVRFCLGYSGWDVGQLDQELRNNVWAVGSMADGEALLKGVGDSYWHRYVRSLGDSYRGWLYHPQYPTFN